MKNWNLLKDKEIVSMIIGEQDFKCNYTYIARMPYMRAKDISDFSLELGFKQKSETNKNNSRKGQMIDLLDYVIQNKKINEFFKNLLNLKRFRGIEKSNLAFSIDEAYWNIVYGFLSAINDILHFNKCYIDYDLQNYSFNLIDEETNVTLIDSEVKNIDRQYIKDLNNQIIEVINKGDYESAVTKSRTLLEEVMNYGIEKAGEESINNGKIDALYNKFKTLYKMHNDPNIDKRINMLLSGFEKIITSISEMRNKNSDAHGVGGNRIELKEHHVTLFANSSIVMANFLLAVVENKE